MAGPVDPGDLLCLPGFTFARLPYSDTLPLLAWSSRPGLLRDLLNSAMLFCEGSLSGY